ncbi:MAG: LLM class F420-dependent oxidoreductase [Chloroflexota bacterium]
MTKIGVVFPQTEFGNDPGAIRDYAQTAEALGFTHILAYDHVLGANPNRPGGWAGPYTDKTPFHEVFQLFSFMAGVTEKIRFVTGILILPQRQTALVAKQAASLDVLSGGRLRLGVGLGWNPVEYQSLNEDFHNRGRRIEEQISVLRRLWTEELVTFEGKWHSIPDAGLNPMPVQRPIPIWFGGHHPNVLRRVGQMGDGWLPNYRVAADAISSWEQIKIHAADAGRIPSEIGMEPRLRFAADTPNDWGRQIEAWEKVGATHFSVNTMDAGCVSAEAHIAAIKQFKEEL